MVAAKTERRCRPRVAAVSFPHYHEAMSFSETIFLFFLALIIFGPKKLPEIARQAGKLLAELRRASNEFKSQIESEIANLELQKNESQRNLERKNEVQKSQAALPPTQAPEGTVASLSLNPAAGEPVPENPEPTATLAAAEAETVNTAVPAAEPHNSSPVVAEASDPATQASHV
jgi:sec-independent protein translocase protein TatB